MNDLPLLSRRAAADAITQVIRSGEPLDVKLESSHVSDKAAVAWSQRLAITTLRCIERADHILKAFVKKPPPPAVQSVLRLAITEIHAMDTPAHAAVDQAVRLLASQKKTAHYRSFANAVLRRAAGEEGHRLWLAAQPKISQSWLRHPLLAAYGKESTARIAAAHEKNPPLDITVRDPSDISRLADLLNAEILPTGSLRLHDRVQITSLHEYHSGTWWVQDAAAALPVKLLGEIEGLNILDMCAAPGGKTMQCAAAGAKVTSLDSSAERLQLLKTNLKRTGLSSDIIHANVLDWQSNQKFDIVIADVPCTATGTIRRHPDVLYRRRAHGWQKKLKQLQRNMLKCAMKRAAPGGRVLYCVCSLLPTEGEEIAAWAQSDLNSSIDPIDNSAVNADKSWFTSEGGIRMRPDHWPDKGGLDGFYAVLLS